MPNRLAGATSPYLLQHKDNPVDWYPWGEEAFQKAKGESKPVFLSVGYSSCHWCHVMEHESFEDEEVAKLLNDHFVSVKVDREERPDVDEAYMTAVQLSSGRGGWPMSVFLTPDKKPFFAGTYFPADDHAGFPGFKSVLRQIAVAWATKREDIEKTGEEFANAIRQTLTQASPGTFETLKPAIIDEAIKAAAGQFDREHGGSQGAPKFPPHSNLELMLHCALREETGDELREAALAMPLVTLEKMCLGGIHDHVGGGFHRYSTDEQWLLPHFEKMLYDNALMMGNLARGSMIAAHVAPRLESLFTRAAMGVLAWLVREMTSPEGLFYSAIDADSEGEEGKFYVWRAEEIRSVLGENAARFMEAFGVEEEGNFLDEATREKTGANILHLRQDDQGQFVAELELLRTARESRVRPSLDNKALVAWNGLAIRSLAELGALSMAERCAQTLLAYEERHGRLPHQITNGVPAGEAFLDGYAFLAHGLFGLAGVREHVEADPAAFQEARVDSSFSAAHWRQNAERLTQEMLRRFYDEEKGGFFSTADAHEELFGRTKPAFDHPVPSANGVAIRCLIEMGDLDRARRSLEAMMGWMQRAPQATETLHLAALEIFDRDEGEVPAPEVREAAPPPAPKLPVADVRVTLEPRELRAGPDGSASGKVLIEVPEGLHLNSNEPPARWLVPTRVEVQPFSAEIHYPAGTRDRYEGLIEIPFTVRLPERENGSDMELRVSFQACTEQECLLPQERLLTGVVVR